MSNYSFDMIKKWVFCSSLFVCVCVCLMPINGAHALEAEETVTEEAVTGSEIMEQVYEHARFHKTQRSEIVMTIQNKQGKKRTRHFILLKKYKAPITRSLIKFYKPANIKGIALLTVANDTEDKPQQWIYFPSFKSVKRLSTKQKDDSFMGSDFTYSDIGGRQLDQDSHQLIKEDEKYYYIKSTPKDSEDHYTYMVLIINKIEKVARKIVFYNRKKEKMKTLYNKEVENIKNGYLVRYSVMLNHLSKSQTHLTVKKIEVGIEIDEVQVGQKGLKN